MSKSLFRSNAMVVPSGDQFGLSSSAPPGLVRRRRLPPSSASTTAMLESKPRWVSAGLRIAKAMLPPSGDH